MMFDLKNVGLKFLGNLAKTPIIVKMPNGRSIDPATQKTVSNFVETQTFAVVRQISADVVSHSNNYLSQNSRQVIFKADNINLTNDSLVVIDNVEYKIKQLAYRNGYFILLVDEK